MNPDGSSPYCWTMETSEHQEAHNCEGDRVLEQVAQRGCRDMEKLSGHGPGQLAIGGLAGAGGWTKWLPEVPSNLHHSVTLWYP